MSDILPKTKCLRKRVSASIHPFSRFQLVGKPRRFQVFKVKILKVNHLMNNTIEPNQPRHKILKQTHMIVLLCSFASRKYIYYHLFFLGEIPVLPDNISTKARYGKDFFSELNLASKQQAASTKNLHFVDFDRLAQMAHNGTGLKKKHDNCQKKPFSFKCFMNWDLGVVWETKGWNVAYWRNSPRKHIRTRSFDVLTTFTLIGNPFLISSTSTLYWFCLTFWCSYSNHPTLWACGVSNPVRADQDVGKCRRSDALHV